MAIMTKLQKKHVGRYENQMISIISGLIMTSDKEFPGNVVLKNSKNIAVIYFANNMKCVLIDKSQIDQFLIEELKPSVVNLEYLLIHVLRHHLPGMIRNDASTSIVHSPESTTLKYGRWTTYDQIYNIKKRLF